ncbi:MAG: hypothetical protein U1F57_04645 [bacterium]
MRKTICAVFAAVLFFFAGSAMRESRAADIKDPPFHAQSKLLYTFPPNYRFEKVIVLFDPKRKEQHADVAFGEISFSPDGQHFAAKGLSFSSPSGDVVMTDGKMGKGYRIVSTPEFSPDSEVSFYTAFTSEEKWVAVINQQEGPPYDSIGEHKFSEEGHSVAYVVEKKEKPSLQAVVVNQKQGDWFDRVGKNKFYIAFTRDGRDFAYPATLHNKEFVVSGKGKGKEYLLVLLPFFSEDGILYYTVQVSPGKYSLVTDGKEGPVYDDAPFGPFFNYSKDKVVFFRMRDHQLFSMSGETLSKKYDQIDLYGGVTDKGEMVAVIQQGKKWFVKVGEREGKLYDWVDQLKVWPDGKKILYIAKEGARSFLVVNEVEEQKYQEVSGLSIHRASGNYAYLASENGQGTIVVNGIKGKSYPYLGMVGEGKIFRFSPDGKKVAYIVGDKDLKWSVALDGREGEKYDEVKNVHFSPDGKQIGYNAVLGDKVLWVVENIK